MQNGNKNADPEQALLELTKELSVYVREKFIELGIMTDNIYIEVSTSSQELDKAVKMFPNCVVDFPDSRHRAVDVEMGGTALIITGPLEV